MAVIINFQEYVNSKKKKDRNTKENNVLINSGKIIYFKREDVSL